jgi:hypothetical protein
MSLQFPTSEYSNEDLDNFLNSMKEIEKSVKKAAMEHSKEWFGKTISSVDVMDEKFNVMLRHPKVKGTSEFDYNKPPTLTAKVPCWSDVWQSEIYDEDGEDLYVKGKTTGVTPLDFLKPKTHVVCLLQCGGLWFVNGKVSITWNLKQAIVQKPKRMVEGVCLLNIKSTDKEKLKTMKGPEEEPGDLDAVNSTIVEDSEDEDENDVEEGYSITTEPQMESENEPDFQEHIVETETEIEPEPEPEAKIVKKKRVIKKKVP